MELGQESDVELERLALGPGVSHWGVYRTADGLFQPFSSVTNRFARLMDPETDDSKGISQINFISLGYGGWWALGVNGRVEYRCGKPFRKTLTEGQKAHKRVSVSRVLAFPSLMNYRLSHCRPPRPSSFRLWLAYGSSFGRTALCPITFPPTWPPKLKITASCDTLSRRTRIDRTLSSRGLRRRDIDGITDRRLILPPRYNHPRPMRPRPRIKNWRIIIWRIRRNHLPRS